MILIVSGEGPTDIGTCTNAQGRCNGADFKPGPMGVMVDKIAEDELGYSLADSSALEFVSEGSLSALMKSQRRILVAGGRRGFETGFFFKGARALARLAKEATEEDETPRGVVFFRDADGTRSSERGLYEARVKSMRDGFEIEGFDLGVPMVPKPKSEAWLICALKSNAYQNCAALEESLSGNDNAPEPAKEQLEALLTERGKSVADLADLVGEGVVDALRTEMKEMPSFSDFDQRLREVLKAMQRHQT
jgi:hypothetical protein